MKQFALFISILLITSIGYAQNKVLIDPYYSPYMGSADLLATQNLIIRGEDYWLRSKVQNPDSYWYIAARAAEEFLFWYPIDNLSAVVQHEVFGHGYRLRQLGLTPESYYITPFAGSTSWRSNGSIPVGEVTAITVAGLEAEAIMARDLKMQWLRTGVIDGRLAPTYTQVAQSLFWYTLITKKGKTESQGLVGNDISSYVYLLNSTYPNGNYSRDKLLNLAYFNLLDPMTFYSYIAMFYYIGTGESWRFPIFTLKKNLQYLPNVRVGYAPYAPEVYLDNYFVINHEPLYVYLRGSSRSYGVGAAFDNVWCISDLNIGFRIDGWNQTKYITSATLNDLDTTGTAYRPSLKDRMWGGALSLIGTLKISQQLKMYLELGGKSNGYLQGYALDAAITARLGVVF